MNISEEFLTSGFGQGFFSDLLIIIAVILFAPITEELIYRGIMLRALHDGLLRYFPNATSMFGIPALGAIIVTAAAFILPHVADFNLLILAYFLTSAGFSIVFLMTRSMVATMMSHSLQSCYAFSTLLVQGHGDTVISPIIYGIAFGCPVLVYVIGTAIKRLFYQT